MAVKSQNGGSGFLLLAGLGIGAFLLLNKSQGGASGSEAPGPSAAEDDIPSAPKIVSVNTSSTESPLPTGIVSDEDGMNPTNNGAFSKSSASGANSDSWDDIPEAIATGSSSSIPVVVSTKLTEKEKAVIKKGVLSNELALKRPDLYKAIYVKKHGKKGNGQQALKAADAIIQQIQVKNAAKSTPAQAKKRKVALKLNTKLVANGSANRAVKPAPTARKQAPTPLVLVKRPTAKTKPSTGRSQAATQRLPSNGPLIRR